MMAPSLTRYLPLAVFIAASVAAAITYLFAPFPWAVGVSACLLLLGALLIIGLHIWTPELDPLDSFVSEYADESPYGWLMHAAFYVIAVGSINLSFLLSRAGLPAVMNIVVLLAGVFVALMGVFSQKSSSIDSIQNSAFEGIIHSASAAASFGLAALSMGIYACWPSATVKQDLAWTRAVGLSLFEITLIAVIIQIVLGLRMVKLAKKHTGKRVAVMVADEFQRRVRQAIGSPALPLEAASKNQPASSKGADQSDKEAVMLKHANQGLGLSERILIFLFLGWVLTLCAISYALLAPQP